jgi:hypothetical protein
MNRGKRISTLEREHRSMVVIAPPIEVIAGHGGLPSREVDGINLNW